MTAPKSTYVLCACMCECMRVMYVCVCVGSCIFCLVQASQTLQGELISDGLSNVIYSRK